MLSEILDFAKLATPKVLRLAMVAFLICLILLLFPSLPLPEQLQKLRPWLPISTIVSGLLVLVYSGNSGWKVFVQKRAAARIRKRYEYKLKTLSRPEKGIVRHFKLRNSRTFTVNNLLAELEPQVTEGFTSLVGAGVMHICDSTMEYTTYEIDEHALAFFVRNPEYLEESSGIALGLGDSGGLANH